MRGVDLEQARPVSEEHGLEGPAAQVRVEAPGDPGDPSASSPRGKEVAPPAAPRPRSAGPASGSHWCWHRRAPAADYDANNTYHTHDAPKQ